MKDLNQKSIKALYNGNEIILTIKDFREWLFLDNENDELNDEILGGFPPIIGPILRKNGLIEDVYLQTNICEELDVYTDEQIDWEATLGEMIPFMADKHLIQWFNKCKHIFK